jgi:phosphohistidine phosphatase
MRRLMLLRHAKTEADAASGRDVDRRLDRRGVSDAPLIGRWLADATPRPRRALVSPAERTRQTWQLILPLLAGTTDVVEVDSLYGASPSEVMEAIRRFGGDASPLLIVGHNPGLHELALALVGSGDNAARRSLESNLPTSALAMIDFDVDSWSNVGLRSGRLVAFISPKTLQTS